MYHRFHGGHAAEYGQNLRADRGPTGCDHHCGLLAVCRVWGAAQSNPKSEWGGAPYNLSLLWGNLAAGLRLSSGGLVSGTPALVAVCEFSVTVSDSRQMWDSRILYLRVEAQPPLAVASGPASLARMVQGQPYNQTLAAIGGTPPYTWSISAGTLPDGITLSLGGVLSGTPTAKSTFSFFILQVTDSTVGTTLTTRKEFRLDVLAPP